LVKVERVTNELIAKMKSVNSHEVDFDNTSCGLKEKTRTPTANRNIENFVQKSKHLHLIPNQEKIINYVLKGYLCA
jgi:hypothetical protein